MDEHLFKTLSQVQREHKPWADHNFPDRVDGHPILGLVEELGEMLRASRLVELADGASDALTFMCDYATTQGIDLSAAYMDACEYVAIPPGIITTPKDLLQCAGRLCHAHLKAAQGIRGKREDFHQAKIVELGTMVRLLHNYCDTHGVVLHTALLMTWNEVKKRDWRANPETGRA